MNQDKKREKRRGQSLFARVCEGKRVIVISFSVAQSMLKIH